MFEIGSWLLWLLTSYNNAHTCLMCCKNEDNDVDIEKKTTTPQQTKMYKRKIKERSQLQLFAEGNYINP